MSVHNSMYTRFLLNLLLGNCGDFSGETTLKVMLCTSAYTPNQKTHEFRADVTNEVVGDGYVAGGKIMTGTNLAITGPTTITFDADDVDWDPSIITAWYAVIYDYTSGNAATDPLVAYINFGEDKISILDSFKLEWSSHGIFNFIVGP